MTPGPVVNGRDAVSVPLHGANYYFPKAQRSCLELGNGPFHAVGVPTFHAVDRNVVELVTVAGKLIHRRVASGHKEINFSAGDGVLFVN